MTMCATEPILCESIERMVLPLHVVRVWRSEETVTRGDNFDLNQFVMAYIYKRSGGKECEDIAQAILAGVPRVTAVEVVNFAGCGVVCRHAANKTDQP